MSSELIERLNDEAMRLHGRSIDRGCVDSSLSGSLALEAAAELEANAAEIGRLREALEKCREMPLPGLRRMIDAALNKQESGNV